MKDLLNKEFFEHDGKKMVRITSRVVPSFVATRLEQPGDREEPATKQPKPDPMLEDMTKAELIEHAEALGVEVDRSAKKADILKAIQEA